MHSTVRHAASDFNPCAMNKRIRSEFESIIRRRSIALVLCAVTIMTGTRLDFTRLAAPGSMFNTKLTFAERMSYQCAIEEVYWRHRIWPNEQSVPKPSLNSVLSQAQLEKKVGDYLRNSQALEA